MDNNQKTVTVHLQLPLTATGNAPLSVVEVAFQRHLILMECKRFLTCTQLYNVHVQMSFLTPHSNEVHVLVHSECQITLVIWI